MIEFLDGRLKNGKDIGTYIDSSIKPNITEMLWRLSYPKANTSYYSKQVRMYSSRGDMDNR